MRRISRSLIFAVAIFVMAAGTGFAIQGWLGLLLWPLGVCVVAVMLGIAWFVIDLVVTYSRHRAHIRTIWARIRPLSTDQLREIVQTPAHRDSRFARVELVRRGINERPQKEQLFTMLTSGNPVMCGQAMTDLHMFYPELHARIPAGSSNQDSPELWRSRIAALEGAG
jgi:hypothetical protein